MLHPPRLIGPTTGNPEVMGRSGVSPMPSRRRSPNSTIQADRKTGQVSGRSVFAVVLKCVGGRAGCSFSPLNCVVRGFKAHSADGLGGDCSRAGSIRADRGADSVSCRSAMLITVFEKSVYTFPVVLCPRQGSRQDPLAPTVDPIFRMFHHCLCSDRHRS
jgi:hypothetical protein